MKSGIELAHVRPSVRAQDDLFRHLNGRWLDEFAMPDDRAVVSVFEELHDRAQESLRTLVEQAAAQAATGEAAEGSEQRKIGDLYASFVEQDRIEALGVTPIRDDLDRVAGIDDRAGLLGVLAGLYRDGVTGPFAAWVSTDAKDPDRYVVYLSQSGLGLPDESFYREEQYAEIRAAYVAHVARMLRLGGWRETEADAGETAARIMALETRLAAGHWDRVANRDVTRTYNLVDRAGLAELAPGFDWSAWIGALRTGEPGAFDEVVVRQPSYLTAMAQAFDQVPVLDWRDWLAWHVISASAPYLSTPLVEENFAFYGTRLRGTPQMRERWRRGLGVVEGALGEALGKLYVEAFFPATSRARVLELVGHLLEAYRRDIEALPWMGADTRARALEKLAKFTPKIGYPDKWRDYSALTISRDDLLGNVRRAAAFELARDLNRIGEPVDRTEWHMTPQTVNAYYNPGMNEIVFPAAILQPPFFDPQADDAANYGGIGGVIGHEIGHGFDDQGSKYDGDGRLSDWWTDQDRAAFDRLTETLIAQYSALEPAQLPGHHVNGALTVGENVGDLGGITVAYQAYRLALQAAGMPDASQAPVLDGLSGDQRFFLAWAQVWRNKIRDEELLRRLATDPHSPAEFRVNAVVRNVAEFHEAFGVRPGDGLWRDPAERVRIW